MGGGGVPRGFPDAFPVTPSRVRQTIHDATHVCSALTGDGSLHFWSQATRKNHLDAQTTHKNGISPTIILGVKPIFKLELRGFRQGLSRRGAPSKGSEAGGGTQTEGCAQLKELQDSVLPGPTKQSKGFEPCNQECQRETKGKLREIQRKSREAEGNPKKSRKANKKGNKSQEKPKGRMSPSVAKAARGEGFAERISRRWTPTSGSRQRRLCSIPGSRTGGVRAVGSRGFSNHFCDTFGNPPVCEKHSLWEALSVLSQKWIPFPTALGGVISARFHRCLRSTCGWSFWSRYWNFWRSLCHFWEARESPAK